MGSAIATCARSAARALVAVSCVGSAGGCGAGIAPPDDARPPAPAESWLVEVTAALGIDFVHESRARGAYDMPESIGAGVALLDVDADGDLDLYLVSGGRNRLLRQEADGTFADATDGSGLGDEGYGMGVAVGDVDNDGDPDVYVTNHGPDRLYRNRGDGTFDDVTAASGAGVDGWSCSAVFLDYDRDGLLDLYVTRYVADDPAHACSDRAGRPEYCGPQVFPPVPDVLLRNTGAGTFTDVSAEAGIATVAAAGLGVVAEDVDGDGWVDVYVANDAYENHLWLNRGDGTFRESAMRLGAACNLQGQPEAGMGVIAEDLDGDGAVDLFVTHLSHESNTLYRATGGASGFADVTSASGLAASSMPFTGFGTAALDLEQDGDLDLVVANGRVFRANPHPDATVAEPWTGYAEPNLVYVNDGAGRFALAPRENAGFGRPVEVSRGATVGDLDGDGDLDVVVTNVQGPARVYRNDAPRRGRWLTVRALDPAVGRDAIGARVTVVAGDRRRVRTVTRAFSYLSSRDARSHFGLGAVERVDRIVVRWPDGAEETFAPAGLDRAVELVRGEGERR
jgi:hypothetical protein